MQYKCLTCGHEFAGREEAPKNRRQCSKCGRRRVTTVEAYRTAVAKVKELRRDSWHPGSPQDAVSALIEALDPASPRATLIHILKGHIGEAVGDPFIAVRTALRIWQDAGHELELEMQEGEAGIKGQ